MSVIARLFTLFRSTPTTAEDIAAAEESARIRDQISTARLSQKSAAGENYQSGRPTNYR